WLENDPNLVAPQLWAGRMRFDAADARRLGCTGLIGIHWRTKVLAPNVSALATASWKLDMKKPPVASDPHLPALREVAAPAPRAGRARFLPVEAFYLDFARAHFGEEVSAAAGRIFARIDGVALPEPSTWKDGPGAIKAEKVDVEKRYRFVDELGELRSRVRGPGNIARFDDWLGTFRFMKAMAQVGDLRARLGEAVGGLAKEPDPDRRRALAQEALALRVELARAWERMVTFLLTVVDSPGELGTLANLEQHTRLRLRFLDAYDGELEAALGRPLPPETALSKSYAGPARLLVPTVRTLARPGESLAIRAMVLTPEDGRGQAAAPSLVMHWRPLGKGAFASAPLRLVSRRVYQGALPPVPEGTFALEYYLEAREGNRRLFWPASAPELPQTVVAAPAGIP
ncbi:MAG: hypothetical protein ACK44W_09945, partial [Planctomycetota bacterium]